MPAECLAHTRDLTADELLVRPNVPADPALREEAADAARGYFAAMRGVDEQVGRVLDHLDAAGLAEDTLVIFTSDHGMQLGSHSQLYKNVPYEESMRVPMLVSWPGTITPGTDEVLMGSAELAPTLLGLLGVQERPGHMVGVDLAAHLRDEPEAPQPTESLYLRVDGTVQRGDVRGIRTRTRKLAITRVDGRAHHRAVGPRGGPLRARRGGGGTARGGRRAVGPAARGAHRTRRPRGAGPAGGVLTQAVRAPT